MIYMDRVFYMTETIPIHNEYLWKALKSGKLKGLSEFWPI
jgi:hypothetical protein